MVKICKWVSGEGKLRLFSLLKSYSLQPMKEDLEGKMSEIEKAIDAKINPLLDKLKTLEAIDLIQSELEYIEK